jgi:hypothetical protein
MYLIQFRKKRFRLIKNQMYKAQYAFNMSMIMCPAVHTATRSLLRSSSTHKPSDPLSRVNIFIFLSFYVISIGIIENKFKLCIGIVRHLGGTL